MARRKVKHDYDEVDDVEDIIEALENFEPETELGRILKELALQGLDEGVERLTPDEAREYLGRPLCDRWRRRPLGARQSTLPQQVVTDIDRVFP
ncbi:MAG: hypothetical protein J2P21_31815 [Chloracidobacterium sp.]|nr:hypothetical protein [Chloracidobacterium sp.]